MSRPRFLTSLLLTGVCLAVVVGLGAAPASAQRVTGHDARADVARMNLGGGLTKTARPSADLVRYAVRYGDHRISAVLRYRDLKPRGAVFVAGLLVSYPGRRDPSVVQVIAGRGNRAGESLVDYVDDARCRTRHRIDYRHDVVRLSVPARCFGRPRYIDASLATVISDRNLGTLWGDVAPGTFADVREAEGDDDSGSDVSSRLVRDDSDYPTVRVRRG